MRSLGFNMNEELAFQIAGKIDTEGTDTLTYDQFKRYLLR
jgi:Ca2+-binding EF-hand superfamily protein